jgi:hypothetical protein
VPGDLVGAEKRPLTEAELAYLPRDARQFGPTLNHIDSLLATISRANHLLTWYVDGNLPEAHSEFEEWDYEVGEYVELIRTDPDAVFHARHIYGRQDSEDFDLEGD